MLHTYKVPNANTVIATHTCKFSVQISIQQLYGKTGCILVTYRCAFWDGCKHLGLWTNTLPGSISAQMLHKLFCSVLTSTWHGKKKSLQTKILWALLTSHVLFEADRDWSHLSAQLFSHLTKKPRPEGLWYQSKTNSMHVILGLFNYFNQTLMVSHFTFYTWNRTFCL